MYSQVEKPKENKSWAVANSVGQKKSNGKQGVSMIDIHSADHKKLIRNKNNFHSSNLFQLKTATYFEDDMDVIPEASLSNITHQRIDMNAEQRGVANVEWNAAGYGAHPPRTVCNHHIPYKGVRDAVFDKIKGNTASEVAWKLNKVGGNIQPPGNNGFQRSELDDSIDTVVGHLANSGNNLFYWPASSGDGNGTLIDNPTPDPKQVAVSTALTNRLANYRIFFEQEIDKMTLD